MEWNGMVQKIKEYLCEGGKGHDGHRWVIQSTWGSKQFPGEYCEAKCARCGKEGHGSTMLFAGLSPMASYDEVCRAETQAARRTGSV